MAYVLQGTDRHYRLTFTDLAEVTGGNPEGRVDLSGATIYYRWKLLQSDPNPAEISKSTAVATEILILAQAGATLGQADVWLLPSDTNLLPIAWHYWDAGALTAAGKTYKKVPTRIQLIDTITDLTVPSPSPSTGPGDGDDVYSLEYAQELANAGTSVTTESLGRVPVASSIASLTAELSEAVTAGSVTIDVLLNSVSVLQVVLNVGTPLTDIDLAYTGTYALDETDTLEVRVTAAAYSNAAAVTADLKVNVGLGRAASLGGKNNFTAVVNPTVNDDSSLDYTVGSRWINVALDLGWECRDASVGAAVWIADAATNLAQSYSKGQKSTVVTLVRSVAALPITLGDSNSFSHVLDADVTLSAPTDQAAKVGQWITIKVQANGTHELAYNAVYEIATAPVFAGMANDEFVILNAYVHAAAGTKSIGLWPGGTMGPIV